MKPTDIKTGEMYCNRSETDAWTVVYADHAENVVEYTPKSQNFFEVYREPLATFAKRVHRTCSVAITKRRKK